MFNVNNRKRFKIDSSLKSHNCIIHMKPTPYASLMEFDYPAMKQIISNTNHCTSVLADILRFMIIHKWTKNNSIIVPEIADHSDYRVLFGLSRMNPNILLRFQTFPYLLSPKFDAIDLCLEVSWHICLRPRYNISCKYSCFSKVSSAVLKQGLNFPSLPTR